MGAAGRRGNLASEIEHSDGDEYETSVPVLRVLGVEDWADSWSEELVIAYHSLIDQCASMGLPFLTTCTFSDFVDFAYQFSPKTPPII